jgi:uncharacterized coiled-coil DUF342 family protein
MKLKSRRPEVDSAERRYQETVAKRDEQNARAQALRSERDTIHQKKRDLIEEMGRLKAERDALVAEMRKHKERRGEFQAKGKALLERKRALTSRVDRRLTSTVETLRLEIRQLEMRHQTQESSIEEERELLDSIRQKTKELKEMESREGEQEDLTLQAGSLDGMIDEAFKKAEEEHQEVLRLNKEAEAVHKQVVEHIEQVNHLVAEGDKKHKDHLEARALADKYHQRSVEMRDKVMALRRAAREERDEERREVDEVNRQVKERFESEDAQRAAEDEILKALREKGRVDIKR